MRVGLIHCGVIAVETAAVLPGRRRQTMIIHQEDPGEGYVGYYPRHLVVGLFRVELEYVRHTNHLTLYVPLVRAALMVEYERKSY